MRGVRCGSLLTRPVVLRTRQGVSTPAADGAEVHYMSFTAICPEVSLQVPSDPSRGAYINLARHAFASGPLPRPLISSHKTTNKISQCQMVNSPMRPVSLVGANSIDASLIENKQFQTETPPNAWTDSISVWTRYMPRPGPQARQSCSGDRRASSRQGAERGGAGPAPASGGHLRRLR